ncbi:MAG TPA: twin-arginine translocase TatA/TatE family subunit [Candidatus Binatia bacterium]|nr:twin-arginine translocase TatA/TatE family subunit [Candidatus Binatia bacterium]
MLGTQDLLIGLVLAAFFFGAKRLPEIARSLGQAMGEFRKGVSGDAGADPASASASTPVRPCPKCGGTMQPGWSHCPHCGARAAAAAESAAANPRNDA